MVNPTCTIEDCAKPARSRTAALCKMHYHRQYRHGDVNRVATGLHTGPPRRYRMVTRHSHPLAYSNGRILEHRAVLYDTIGPGPHPCHWCSAPVDWLPKGDPDSLQVDHLNGQTDDNKPSNLVPSCLDCNSTRGKQARHERLRAAGFWSGQDTVSKSQGRKPLVDPVGQSVDQHGRDGSNGGRP